MGVGKRAAYELVHGQHPFGNYLEVHWLCGGGLSAVNAIGTHAIARPNKLGTDPMAYGGFK